MQLTTTINRQNRRLTRDVVLWGLVFSAVGAALFALMTTQEDPNAAFNDFVVRFLGIFIEAVPFLLMGVFVSGLLEVYVTREDIVRWIPRNPIAATLSGALMGFAFPVCECGVVPVTRRLFSKGLPMSVGVAFLLAAPVMNPIVFVSTFIAFENYPGGREIIILRFLITAVVAISIGLLFALAAKPHETLRPVSWASIGGGDGEAITPASRPTSFWQGLTGALRVSTNDFFDMGRYLVIGSALAAGMQTFVPQSTLEHLGSGPLLSVLALQGLAFVLSACSTVDAFLAISFTQFSTGSILAFLTFGPMVDIKSTLMYAGVFKPRIVAYLVILPLLMTLLIGFWINLAGG